MPRFAWCPDACASRVRQPASEGNAGKRRVQPLFIEPTKPTLPLSECYSEDRGMTLDAPPHRASSRILWIDILVGPAAGAKTLQRISSH